MGLEQRQASQTLPAFATALRFLGITELVRDFSIPRMILQVASRVGFRLLVIFASSISGQTFLAIFATSLAGHTATLQRA
jgi:hypothetical protein